MERERIALVTGSAGGIGRAVCAELAKTCRAIIGFDIPKADQEQVKVQCEANGAEFYPVKVDISNEDSVKGAFKIVDKLGRLDIVVNLAGINLNNGPSGFAWDTEHTPLDEWNLVISINLTGTFLVSREAIPYLKKNGWGRIITTSSQTGRLVSTRAGAHYASSKGGIGALTRVMAAELGPYGITVNCLAPGLTATGMSSAYPEEYIKAVPMQRLGKPVDHAGVVAFLASDAAEYITGATIDVNGGKFMAL